MNRSASGCQKPSSTHLPSKNHMRTSGHSAACAITWAAPLDLPESATPPQSRLR